MLPQRAQKPHGQRASKLADEDVATNEAIGEHGMKILQARQQQLGRTLNVLTHCNAGWMATVDWGTALAVIYKAHDAGVPLHVWVDETRPRNQGLLTAWELRGHGVPHTYIVDNAGGHLMQHGKVDLVLVGADRVSRTGDVANKIGTYLKATGCARQRHSVSMRRCRFPPSIPHLKMRWRRLKSKSAQKWKSAPLLGCRAKMP